MKTQKYIKYPEHITDRERLHFEFIVIESELELLFNLYPEDEKYMSHRMTIQKARLQLYQQMDRIKDLEKELFEAQKGKSEALAELQVKKTIIKNIEKGLE